MAMIYKLMTNHDNDTTRAGTDGLQSANTALNKLFSTEVESN